MKSVTRIILIATLVVFTRLLVFGQLSKIAVQHNGSSSFYTNLNTALTASVSGDTVYLPGGPIQITTTPTIDKKLTVIGAGHYPDSTKATNQTILYQLNIVTGADGGSLQGVLATNLYFGTSAANQNVNNYMVERCYIQTLKPSFTSGSTSQNILFRENVILNSVGSSGYGFALVLFEKNIMNINSGGSLVLYKYSGATFVNNLLLMTPYNNGALVYSPEYSSYMNNIFCVTNSSYNFTITSTNCIFNFTHETTSSLTNSAIIWSGTSSFISNSLNRETITNTFTSYSGGGFSYSSDFHLKTTSNGHNAGSDGTDVGIYGTSAPYKEHGVPSNPHISSKMISSNTGANGMLGVSIKVVAQER